MDIANYTSSPVTVYHGESVWDKCIANLTPCYNVNSLICSGHLLKRMRGQCIASGNDRHIYNTRTTPPLACTRADRIMESMYEAGVDLFLSDRFCLYRYRDTNFNTLMHHNVKSFSLVLVRIRKPIQNLSK